MGVIGRGFFLGLLFGICRLPVTFYYLLSVSFFCRLWSTIWRFFGFCGLPSSFYLLLSDRFLPSADYLLHVLPDAVAISILS